MQSLHSLLALLIISTCQIRFNLNSKLAWSNTARFGNLSPSNIRVAIVSHIQYLNWSAFTAFLTICPKKFPIIISKHGVVIIWNNIATPNTQKLDTLSSWITHFAHYLQLISMRGCTIQLIRARTELPGQLIRIRIRQRLSFQRGQIQRLEALL